MLQQKGMGFEAKQIWLTVLATSYQSLHCLGQVSYFPYLLFLFLSPFFCFLFLSFLFLTLSYMHSSIQFSQSLFQEVFIKNQLCVTHYSAWQEYRNEENRQKSLLQTLHSSAGRDTIKKLSRIYSILDHDKCYGNSKTRKGGWGVGKLTEVLHRVIVEGHTDI